MKRLLIMIMALLLMFTFLACAKQESIYTVKKNGIDFQVDTERNIISDAANTYKYDYSGNASSFNITITYPNGSSYWYGKSGGMGSGGWSNDYDESAYVDGDTLVEVVQANAPKERKPGKFFGAFILAALGIFDILFPKAAWYLGYGWRFQNAEPSGAALIFARISGAVAVILGVVLLLR